MKLNKTHLAVALIGSALFMASSAQAAKIKTAEKVDSVSVSLQELNLDNASGQEAAYKRLKRAARNLCGSPNLREAGGLEQAMSNRECFSETLTEAVETLDNRDVSALHRNS